MTENESNAKVLFLVKDEDGGVWVETLWATTLGDDLYRLDNSPFYAYSVSWEDVIYAPYNDEEGFPVFERVIEKSGNKTIRVIFDPPAEEGNQSDRVLQGLVDLGCSYEGASPSYIAINVPEIIDLERVARYLIECEAKWEHANPSYSDLFPDDV